MSRQEDLRSEDRGRAKRNELVKALEYGIVEALESEGVELLGFAFKYDAYSCLMTIKASIGKEISVSFVGSDTIINCILKAQTDAWHDALHWKACKYHLK